MTDHTLGEELLLLAVADGDGADATALGHAMAGAAVVELTLAGRLDTADGRIVVLDPAPTGRAHLDAVLAQVADSRSRSGEDWIRKLAGSAREPVRNDLGPALVEAPRKLFGLVSGGLTVADPTVARRIAGRAQAGLAPDADARSVALLGLLDAAGLRESVLPGVSADAVAARLDGAEAGGAVADARRGLEAVRFAVAAVRNQVTLNTTTYAPSNTILFGNN